MSRSTSLPAPPIIRLAHPLAFAAYLRHIGAPVDHHLRRQGLPVFCDDPNQFVPLHKAWAFFDATARSEDAMLGWHVGRFLGDYNLNRGLLRRVESAPTLYEALKTMVRLISSEASQLQLGLLEHRHDVLFCTHYSTFFKDIPGYASSQAYQLGIFLDLIRHFAGQQWVPDEIGIEYPSVPAVAEELFGGCRILTHQRMGYIAVPRSCLHLAAPGSDLERSGDDSLVATTRLDYVDTLGTLITPHLEEGYPSSRLAASLMDTSVRTLARRLTAHGVTYREVVDNLRFKIARDLLQDTDLRISEVARSVGFDDPAHFTRMFRRIAGLSPRGFREEEPTRR